MIKDVLTLHGVKSNAKYVDYGYGQVEPNHLSAQRTGQIYAQLPAAGDIKVLENGQFVKYDYMNEVVNFSADAPGEWMLVYNEIKLYRDHQLDCEFAMIKDNYNARVYSPMDGVAGTNWDAQSRHYNGTTIWNYDSEGNKLAEPVVTNSFELKINGEVKNFEVEDVTAKSDMYELHYNEDPFHFESKYQAKMMPKDTKMVPRVFKTNVGDIFTTNCVDEETLELGDILAPVAGTGYLSKSGDTDKMKWQVVKLYTMPDRQKGVKLMRVE